jgi:hypothetical protein
MLPRPGSRTRRSRRHSSSPAAPDRTHPRCTSSRTAARRSHPAGPIRHRAALTRRASRRAGRIKDPARTKAHPARTKAHPARTKARRPHPGNPMDRKDNRRTTGACRRPGSRCSAHRARPEHLGRPAHPTARRASRPARSTGGQAVRVHLSRPGPTLRNTACRTARDLSIPAHAVRASRRRCRPDKGTRPAGLDSPRDRATRSRRTPVGHKDLVFPMDSRAGRRRERLIRVALARRSQARPMPAVLPVPHRRARRKPLRHKLFRHVPPRLRTLR